jgi:hypothetical protein
MYPDLVAKASMTRVIANIIGRRSLSDAYYACAVPPNFLNQLRDDLADYQDDRQAGRLTPFTYPIKSSDTNPLYDLFAYSAYISHRVFNDDPKITEVLAYYNANRVAVHLLTDPQHTRELMQAPDITDELAQFIQLARGLSKRMARNLQREDLKLQQTVGDMFRDRPQTDIDPRTFISDRIDYINEVITRGATQGKTGRLNEIVEYVLSGGGKRLRPALSLMLAESLDVPYQSIEPLLTAIELFHTSSLVFDDLPAQDNATLRRGKATAHMAFDEAGAQLAGISMLSSGFGLLGELSQQYPTHTVTGVVKILWFHIGTRTFMPWSRYRPTNGQGHERSNWGSNS